MPSAIEDYTLIGDCKTAALVGRDGSIDWLCLPRFDSGACFAALLGDAENGRWQLRPDHLKQTKRRYRPGTLILETEFETTHGALTLTDFMVPGEKHSSLVRLVRGTRGEVRMNMELVMRFDYGHTVPWVSRREGALVAVAGPHMLVLRTAAPTHGENLKTVSKFTVHQGQTMPFCLTYGLSHLPVPAAIDIEQAMNAVEQWWQDWIAGCNYNGPWADAVRRSLITLKALSYQRTGAILAAPTTSLPEELGQTRNWDYRYCWLRDATFTLLALMEGGHYDEAKEWRDWLVRAVAGSADQVCILYGAAGERHFIEWEVPWLRGYHNASPVRVGNAAALQVQLDVYGEIADVLHLARRGGLEEFEPAIELQKALIAHLETIWQDPDQGIWEFRGPKRHFTHSKVMAWVAFDRMIKGHQQFGIDAPVERWRALRKKIHDEVCRCGFDAELGSFVQSYGSKQIDASLLLIPMVGFLPVSDPRVKSTVEQIEKRLLWNGFVRRYDTAQSEDGLPAGEGAFLACSFWLADNYTLMGRRADAEQLLMKLLNTCNGVSLLPEEYDPEHQCFLGNFPQAFSHVALVNSVLNFAQKVAPVEKRANTQRLKSPSHKEAAS
jgi:GH15 family glucan-1,4-alpha-glucosidase